MCINKNIVVTRIAGAFKRISVLALTFCSSLCVAQINVTPNQTAQILSQKLAGPGITVSNATLSCPAIANGIFKVVSSNLGIDSGIILTTGRAATVGNSIGCNAAQITNGNNANASTNNGAAGDPQLSALANANTFDACKLEFDLIPTGDSINFNYVFGSEEYWKSTCSNYNDAFAFFISGPNIIGQENIALVPGTNIPVAVNSINSGVAGIQGNIANCHAMGPGSPFPAYFVNNAAGTTVSYYGMTTVLTAAHAVTPCSTYHLKITIADAGNGLYDSGVFLKAGSLKTTSFEVSAIGRLPDTSIVKGCAGGKFIFTSTQKKANPQTVKFIIAGSAINGTDYATIADSVVIPANDSVASININGLVTPAGGIKTIKIYLLSPYVCNGNNIIDSAVLKLLDAPSLHMLTPDTGICLGGSIGLQVQGHDSLVYSWSPTNSLNNATVANPVATPSSTTTYTVSGTWPLAGCPVLTDQVTISITTPPVVNAGDDTTICTGASTVLNATVTPPSGTYTYTWSGPNGTVANTISTLLTNVTSIDSGIYTISVNIPGCSPVTDQLLIKAVPAVDVDPGPAAFICIGGILHLTATVAPSNPSYTYSWSGPNGFLSFSSDTTLTDFAVSDTGIYVITVSKPGCAPVSEQLHVDGISAIGITLSDTSLCVGTPLHFSPIIDPQGGTYTYQWLGPNGFTSAIPDPAIDSVSTANGGSYILTVTSQGCVSTDSFKLKVNSLPPAPDVTDFSPIYYCQNNDATALWINVDQPKWYADVNSTGTYTAPIPQTAEKGVYPFYVSQVVNKCEGPKSLINVVVQKCCDDSLCVPSAFSPNGDGHNDKFHIPESPNHRIQYMYIYNRWGQLVFSSDYYNQSWDGTYNGAYAEVGAYYYYLSAECKDGAIVKKQGNITLVR